MFDNFNSFYKINPPEIILDDIGIHHTVEVPLPAKYEKSPCECKILHKWENSQTFEIYSLHIGTDNKTEEKIFKNVKRCLTCNQILTLQIFQED